MKNVQVEQARHDFLMGNRSQARSKLRQVLRNDRQNKEAWLLFAELAVNDLQRIYCLEQVLLIEPKNTKAQRWLREFRNLTTDAASVETPDQPDNLSLIDDTTPLQSSSAVSNSMSTTSPAQTTVPKKKPITAPSPGEKNCPYVGLEHDRESLAAFPNSRNSCYLTQPPESISLSYQKEFCLSPNHVNCTLLEKRRKKGSLLSVLIDKAEKGG